MRSLTTPDIATASLSSSSLTYRVVLTSTALLSCGVSVLSDEEDLETEQRSLPSSTSMSVSGDITAVNHSSVRDVSVPPVAVAALAASDIR